MARRSSVIRHPGAFVLIAYSALSVALLRHTLLGGDLGHHQVGWPGDPTMFAWHLAWVPHAIGHGLNPLVTKLVAAPSGANLMWSTSIVAPSLLMSPLTVLAGPIVSYDVLVFAAIVADCFAAFVCFKRFVSSALAAAVGGAVYGVSPVVVGQAVGHVNLLIVVFPPLVLLLLHELFVRQRWSWWITGAALGAAFAVQLLTTEEYVALTTVIAVTVGFVIVVRRGPSWPRRSALYAVSGLTTAATTAMALAALPLWEQFAGPRRVHGQLQPAGRCVTDLAELAMPTARQLIAMPHVSASVFRYSCYGGEMSGYLGLPLLVGLPIAVLLCRRRPAARLAAAIGGCALIFAAGPRLRLFNHETQVPMPWAAVGRLPLLDSALPDRFMVFVFLAVGLLTAVVLTEVRSLSRGAVRRGAAAVSIACLVPLVPASLPATRVTVPTLFTSADVEAVPANANVLVAPLQEHGYTAMIWQATAKFRFRMPEGAVFIPGPSFAPDSASPLFGAIRTIEQWGAPTTPPPCRLGSSRGEIRVGSCRVLFMRELRARQISAVIVGPGGKSEELVSFFEDLLGERSTPVGGARLWAHPVALGPDVNQRIAAGFGSSRPWP